MDNTFSDSDSEFSDDDDKKLLDNSFLLDEVIDTDKQRNTALLRAVLNGDFDLVKQLITSTNAKVNQKNRKDETALHLAVASSHDMAFEILSTLLQVEGISVNALNRRSHTPLWIAIENQKFGLAKQLITHPDTYIHPNQYSTLIEYIAEKGDLTFFNALINHPRFDITSLSESSVALVKKAVQEKIQNLTRAVQDFHPKDKHWYDNQFFRWLQSLFAPVRKMKDAVRDVFITQLGTIKTDNPSTAETQITTLIDRFITIQKYIEVTRQETVDGKDVVAQAKDYLSQGKSTELLSKFNEAAHKSHAGIIKENDRKDRLLKILKPTP